MSLIVVGNLNKRYSLFIDKLYNKGIHNSTIICTGSLGIRTEDDFKNLTDLNRYLHSVNCHLYVIRGCFDNYEYFNGTYILENIKLCADFSNVTIDTEQPNKKALLIGGGIPLDRSLPNRLYVPQPKITALNLSEFNYLKGTVDYIVLHQPPDLFHVENTHLKFWTKLDKTLFDDYSWFTKQLTYIVQLVEAKTVFFSGLNNTGFSNKNLALVQVKPLSIYDCTTRRYF